MIRGAITNGPSWVFIIVTLNGNYSKASYTSSLEINMHNNPSMLDLVCAVMFSSDFRPIFLLSYLRILILLPLSYADYIGLLLPFLLSLITPIVDRPLYYLVADLLSLYLCCGSYPVQYINPQSGGTVSLGLCPLCSLTLTRLESTGSI